MNVSRTLCLNQNSSVGKSVVYVMSRDQRVADNHALLEAQKMAIAQKLSLNVVFFLYTHTTRRSYEHVKFMLDGLVELKDTLSNLGITFTILPYNSERSAIDMLRLFEPTAVYFDFSPLKGPRTFAKSVAEKLGTSTYVVDTHNIIPIWTASDKQEFAAYTFRSKVHQLISTYLAEPQQISPHPYATTYEHPDSISFSQADDICKSAYPKRNIKILYRSGESHAKSHLRRFIQKGLATYATDRNDIASDMQSGLSPYLHFGQISSLRVALDTMSSTGNEPLLYREAKMPQSAENKSAEDGMNALFEEMIVRKELSDNFCFYNHNYMSLDGVHQWAINSLHAHTKDTREYVYSREQFEQAETHDVVWNSAQRELTTYGKMHGYMRMYWAKKILEWSPSPDDAISTAIYLNDAYSIDGGDPNGYVGILWAIAGLHDRPWIERNIFGKIRYMNEAGLRRKFDVDAYCRRVQ